MGLRHTWTRPLIGRVIGGRFRLEQLLGVGGMGAVYRACHLAVGRQVAIKIVAPAVAARIDLLSRFHKEAQAAASVCDPGVVEVIDFAADAKLGPFMVMELLRGETLATRLRRDRCSAKEASRLVAGLLGALTAVHARGIVHRDLKPENVFVTHDRDGKELVKILDFGVSRLPGPGAPLTQQGTMLGTPRYMAPEQASRPDGVDHRADIYSVGAILYATLTGHDPYRGVPRELVMPLVMKGPPQPLKSARPDLPDALCEVVARAMARDPEERFVTATTMCTALLAAVPDEPQPSAGPSERSAAQEAASLTVSGASTLRPLEYATTAAPGSALPRPERFRGPLAFGASVAVVGLLISAWSHGTADSPETTVDRGAVRASARLHAARSALRRGELSVAQEGFRELVDLHQGRAEPGTEEAELLAAAHVGLGDVIRKPVEGAGSVGSAGETTTRYGRAVEACQRAMDHYRAAASVGAPRNLACSQLGIGDSLRTMGQALRQDPALASLDATRPIAKTYLQLARIQYATAAAAASADPGCRTRAQANLARMAP